MIFVGLVSGVCTDDWVRDIDYDSWDVPPQPWTPGITVRLLCSNQNYSRPFQGYVCLNRMESGLTEWVGVQDICCSIGKL